MIGEIQGIGCFPQCFNLHIQTQHPCFLFINNLQYTIKKDDIALGPTCR